MKLKFRGLLLAIILGALPAAAQDAVKIQKAVHQLQTLSESSLDNIRTGNMDQAVKDYTEIMSVIENTKTDTLAIYLPFYVENDLHEPIIRYAVHQDYEEGVSLCNFYLYVQFCKIRKWFESGDIKTEESFISNLAFQYTKLAHWLAEEGLYDEAEICHTGAIKTFEKAGVSSQDYADELWDMADFQQMYRNDYLESLRYHYKNFKVLTGLYGIESKDVADAFDRMRTVYGISISGLGFQDDAAKFDALIPEYATGKAILNTWGAICSEIKEECGDDALSAILRKSFVNSMIPIQSYEAEMACIYCNETLLDLVYEKNDGFYKGLQKVFELSLSDEEYTIYLIRRLHSALDKLGYVEQAMNVLASRIVVLSDGSDRMDLVEYLSSILAPLAARYQNHQYFTISTTIISPLLFRGDVHYYDIENYLAIIGAALQYYCYEPEISDNLCHVADSLLSTHDQEIASSIKEMICARIADVRGAMGNEQSKSEYLEKAIHWQQALISELYEKQWDKSPDSPMWPVFAFTELAILYGRNNDFENAKNTLEKCLRYYELNDADNVDLDTIYSELVWVADKTHNVPDFEKYAPQWLDCEINAYLLKSFSMLKRDRISYFYNTPLPFILEIIADASLNNENLVGQCYNAALSMKGFLLNQERTISRNASSSDDPELLDTYKKFTEALISGNPDVDRYEYEFMYRYFMHPEFREDFCMPTWQDVANALDKNAIAIEFIAGSNTETDVYAALLLKKGWDKPVIVKLADKSAIDRYASDVNIYKPGTPAYSMIWGNIEPYLKGIKTIYFSPYRALCKMNIEVLLNEKGVQLNERYETHRLSSTFLLCEHEFQDGDYYDSALLFGGLDYDADTSYMKKQNIAYFRGRNISRFIDLNMHNRKGWSYLPGTKREVEKINTILTDNVKVELYEKDNGTESVFKSYNGKSPSIIHMATHGFYLEQEDARHEPMFEHGGVSTQYIEPMKRSGLILSGGQHAWLGEPIPEVIEDGILTAEEISGMDLSGTELLVLSACQTGLGDVTGEGVYGLQRGFKLAGVETIVMSLWAVNDMATELLMTTFYTSLTKGKSKYESFENAIEKVKKQYIYPKYWAAFILLD